jgi:hypothetical protein
MLNSGLMSSRGLLLLLIVLLQVEAVLQRLAGTAGLRKTVPVLMSSALEQQLQALRPPAEDTAEAAGGHVAVHQAVGGAGRPHAAKLCLCLCALHMHIPNMATLIGRAWMPVTTQSQPSRASLLACCFLVHSFTATGHVQTPQEYC